MPRKLLYITASYPYGRVEGFLTAELSELARLGVEVDVLPSWKRGERSYANIWSSTGLRELSAPDSVYSMFLGFLFFFWKYPFLWVSLLVEITRSSPRNAIKNIVMLGVAGWVISKNSLGKYDHIVAHWATTPSTLAYILSRVLRIPFGFTCHRGDIVLGNLLHLKGDKAGFVRFISNKGIDMARAKGMSESAPTQVIPMGVNLPPSGCGRKLDLSVYQGISIICVANLLPVKGHRYLFEAVSELINTGLPVDLMVAGDGPMKKELKEYADELGIRNYIKFLGHISHGRLFSLYESGEVHFVVLPSINAPDGQHEGVPVSLMEAMSFGIPVVSTQTGSIEELLPLWSGLTVVEKNPKVLAEKLRELTLPDRYIEASETVLRLVGDNYSIEKNTGLLLRVCGLSK